MAGRFHRGNTDFQRFCIPCTFCGSATSKAYARTHEGACKACTTGESKRGLVCPTCGGHTLTAYQKARGYHCDGCTREADPMGYAQELRGY
jgi:hypothetical protein